MTIRQTIVPVAGKLTMSMPKTGKGKCRVAVLPNVITILTEHRHHQEAEGQSSVRLGESGLVLVFTTEIGTAIHPDSVKCH